MKTIGLLRNTPRDYAWGSHEAIARLQGRPVPTAGPEAELWMGAHPRGPSEVEIDGQWVSLFRAIQLAPDEILGAPVAERFGPRLPFLLKLLAAARPLSIQAHPDAAQARAGFARENARGLPLGATERCYVDDSHKPELLCALSSFIALRGFRPPHEICAGVRALVGDALDAELDALTARPDAEGLRHFLESILSIAGERRRRVLGAAVNAAEAASAAPPEVLWVRRLAREFPGDLGALSPLFLNLVELAPGEAMYLPSGELHAYLEGFGLELMASSDNVLRGGLTAKHVDVPELLRVLRFHARPPQVLHPVPRGPRERVYVTPAQEFELEVIDLGAGGPFDHVGPHAAEILLCSEGAARLRDLGAAAACELACGAAALVPAAVERYRLEGEGRVYKASVPLRLGEVRPAAG